MNEKQLDLALSFINEQPLAASRILEQQPPDQTAVFISSIPLFYQSKLIANILPVYAARVFECLQAEERAGISSSLEVSELTRILRILPELESSEILGMLRKIKRKSCEILLNYPLYSVGAWMSQEVASICSDMTIADARQYLANTFKGENADNVYVTDRKGRLEGRLDCIRLIRGNDFQLIHEVMCVDPPWMSPNFLLKQAEQSHLWSQNDLVAITDSEQQLQGVFKHSDLRAGLSHYQDPEVVPEKHSEELIATLSKTYASSMMVLFNTAFNIVETDLKS